MHLDNKGTSIIQAAAADKITEGIKRVVNITPNILSYFDNLNNSIQLEDLDIFIKPKEENRDENVRKFYAALKEAIIAYNKIK